MSLIDVIQRGLQDVASSFRSDGNDPVAASNHQFGGRLLILSSDSTSGAAGSGARPLLTGWDDLVATKIHGIPVIGGASDRNPYPHTARPVTVASLQATRADHCSINSIICARDIPVLANLVNPDALARCGSAPEYDVIISIRTSQAGTKNGTCPTITGTDERGTQPALPGCRPPDGVFKEHQEVDVIGVESAS